MLLATSAVVNVRSPQAGVSLPSVCPAMPSIVTNLRAATKTDEQVLNLIKSEEVILHTNLTHNAPMNDCVRYFDIGKEQQESDVICGQARNRANPSPKQSPKKSPKQSKNNRHTLQKFADARKIKKAKRLLYQSNGL